MKIGGLQKVTLLDYPEKVAAIVFTSGCNFRCPFCYNPTLVLPELIAESQFIPPGELLAFLKKRKKYLDGVVISGGEPTLNPKLIPLLEKIKNLGYEIKLDTNGAYPEILQTVIKRGLVDYLALDIKGPLEEYEKFCGVPIEVEKIKTSIKLVKNSSLPYEFRSTIVKGWHQQEDFEKMAQAISGARLYYLQNFSPGVRLVKKDFSGRLFTPKELAELKILAEKYVKKCLVR